jgi:hypothetical protein
MARTAAARPEKLALAQGGGGDRVVQVGVVKMDVRIHAEQRRGHHRDDAVRRRDPRGSIRD